MFVTNMAFRSDMSTALITGIAGFTGHYLANDLQSLGYQVVGLDHTHGMEIGNAPLQDAGAISIYRCDLLDKANLVQVIQQVQPDVVVHLAAIAFVAHGDVDAIYRINVVGTRNLLEALASAPRKPSAVLLASSANIYGNTLVDPIDETVEPNPANDYAVSKLAMEYMAKLWQDRLPIVIVRPFNYTGIGQSMNFLLPKIVDHFRRGARDIELGNLDVARDFSDVRMVSASYCGLLQAVPAGQVFNVCSGVAYTLQEVLSMMADVAGYRINVTVNPAFVRANEVKTLRGSNARLLSVIGNLKTVPLRETLQWLFQGRQA